MAPKQDTLKIQDLASQYGIAASFLKTDKSLLKVLKKILAEKITDPTRMLAMINETSWAKDYSASLQNYNYLKETTPAKFEEQFNAQKQLIVQKATALGIELDDATVNDLTDKYMRGSTKRDKNGNMTFFDGAWLNNALAANIDFSKTKTIDGIQITQLEGGVQDIASKIYKTAYEYGINTTMSDKAFRDWFQGTVRGLVAGTTTNADVDKQIQDMAISHFPGLTKQLQSGLTLRQAAAAPLSAIAKELELDFNNMDLNDNIVQQVLNSRDKDGNFAPMTAYEARQAARKDSRWKFTEGAKNEYTSIGSKILQDFGFGA